MLVWSYWMCLMMINFDILTEWISKTFVTKELRFSSSKKTPQFIFFFLRILINVQALVAEIPQKHFFWTIKFTFQTHASYDVYC